MDDEHVLRSLGDALERDDPRLAALLRAGPAPAGRPVLTAAEAASAPPGGRTGPPGWSLVVAGLLAAAVVAAAVVLGPVVVGAVGLVLLIASPLAVCWWCDCADELRPPDEPPGR
ncbi:hypothetical protein ACI8AF_04190 [Blastococcus sp. SYSU D00669]